MTENLAHLLAARLAALPFTDRVAGIVRPYPLTVTGEEPGKTRTVLVPCPVGLELSACEATARYLLPDSGVASVLFFEDLGTLPGGIANVPGSWRSGLRLLGWVNPQHFATPPTDLQLVGALTAALAKAGRETLGEYVDLSISVGAMPADSGLFSRYSGLADNPLLLPPYRVVGLDLSATYRLNPACAGPMPERVTPASC